MKHCDKLAVTINPTNRCNLRCDYCMASSAEEQDNPIIINLDFARNGIKDAIMGYPTGIPVTIIRFFSPGEPTQEMDTMKSCMEYARFLNPHIKTELQTNGLFKSFEDAKWIADNFEIVWISLDGPAEINDINRPDKNGQGRTKEIEEYLKFVLERTSVGVRSTIKPESYHQQKEMVEYYYELGIMDLAFNPIIYSIERRDKGQRNVTYGDVMDFSKEFITAYKRAMELNVYLMNSLTFNFDEPTKIACRSCVPTPQLNPDGSVSSCDMALYYDTKEELQCFIYGTWRKKRQKIKYYLEKIEYLSNRKLANIPVCKDCKIGPYCAGSCAGRVAYQTGSIYKIIPEYCMATKYLASKIPLGQGKMRFTHP